MGNFDKWFQQFLYVNVVLCVTELAIFLNSMYFGGRIKSSSADATFVEDGNALKNSLLSLYWMSSHVIAVLFSLFANPETPANPLRKMEYSELTTNVCGTLDSKIEGIVGTTSTIKECPDSMNIESSLKTVEVNGHDMTAGEDSKSRGPPNVDDGDINIRPINISTTQQDLELINKTYASAVVTNECDRQNRCDSIEGELYLRKDLENGGPLTPEDINRVETEQLSEWSKLYDELIDRKELQKEMINKLVSLSTELSMHVREIVDVKVAIAKMLKGHSRKLSRLLKLVYDVFDTEEGIDGSTETAKIRNDIKHTSVRNIDHDYKPPFEDTRPYYCAEGSGKINRSRGRYGRNRSRVNYRYYPYGRYTNFYY